MHAATLIGWVLLALAVAAQVRARRLRPPPPVAARVEVRVVRGPDAVEVEVRGARGLALSLHDARWSPPVPVLSASGPLTLVSGRDVRRYRLAAEATGVTELTGVWEQLTFGHAALRVDLSRAEAATASRPTARSGTGRHRGASDPAGGVARPRSADPARSRSRPPRPGWPPRAAG